MDNDYERSDCEVPLRARYPRPPDHPIPPWTPILANAGYPHGHPPQCAAGAAFAGLHFGIFGCPPSGLLSSVAPGAAALNPHHGAGLPHFPVCPEQPRVEAQGPSYRLELESCRRQQGQERLQQGGKSPGVPQWSSRGTVSRAAQSEDEPALQTRLDVEWLQQFSQRTKKRPQSPPTPQQACSQSLASLGHVLSATSQLVRRLEQSCLTLNHTLEKCGGWGDAYAMALHVKRELQDRVRSLGELKAQTWRAARRRVRRLRARAERRQAEERSSEREAAINRWRMKRIQQVEEKKKEKELKLAADSVLSEVRKKQADVKRMQDVLRSLEKLRRLRKDAACRRGIVTDQQCDVDFNTKLEQLRCLLKKRTVVYSAEEKALMVMLEGEQEEERKREQERRGKKERERQLQRKCMVDSILFGEECPSDRGMQPFTQYYTQAQQSLRSLIQVRKQEELKESYSTCSDNMQTLHRKAFLQYGQSATHHTTVRPTPVDEMQEWDLFMVSADRPDGSTVPHSWIMPDPPSDTAWASAQQTPDTDWNS